MTSERHGSEEKTVAEKALSLSPSHSFVPRRTFGGYFFCLTKAPYALLLFVTLVLERAKVAMRIYAPRRRTNAFYVCTIVSWREGSGRERRGRRDDGKPPEERVRLGGGGKSRRRCTMWQVCERTREREREREKGRHGEPTSDMVGPKGFDVSSRFGGEAAPGSSISGV